MAQKCVLVRMDAEITSSEQHRLILVDTFFKLNCKPIGALSGPSRRACLLTCTPSSPTVAPAGIDASSLSVRATRCSEPSLGWWEILSVYSCSRGRLSSPPELGASRCGWDHVVQSPAAQASRWSDSEATCTSTPGGRLPFPLCRRGCRHIFLPSDYPERL